MSESLGIVLTATAISFGNEWVNTNTPNFRIAVAGVAVGVLFDGIERFNQRAAVGLSVLMLITVIVTPFSGKTPFDTALDWVQGTPPKALAKKG